MAIYSNLSVDQGSTFSVEIDVTDVANDPLNLAGYTVDGKIRKTYTSSTSTSFTSSITNAAGDTVKRNISANQTNNMKAGRYVYDVAKKKTTTRQVIRQSDGQLEMTQGDKRENK